MAWDLGGAFTRGFETGRQIRQARRQSRQDVIAEEERATKGAKEDVELGFKERAERRSERAGEREQAAAERLAKREGPTLRKIRAEAEKAEADLKAGPKPERQQAVGEVIAWLQGDLAKYEAKIEAGRSMIGPDKPLSKEDQAEYERTKATLSRLKHNAQVLSGAGAGAGAGTAAATQAPTAGQPQATAPEAQASLGGIAGLAASLSKRVFPGRQGAPEAPTASGAPTSPIPRGAMRVRLKDGTTQLVPDNLHNRNMVRARGATVIGQ